MLKWTINTQLPVSQPSISDAILGGWTSVLSVSASFSPCGNFHKNMLHSERGTFFVCSRNKKKKKKKGEKLIRFNGHAVKRCSTWTAAIYKMKGCGKVFCLMKCAFFSPSFWCQWLFDFRSPWEWQTEKKIYGKCKSCCHYLCRLKMIPHNPRFKKK